MEYCKTPSAQAKLLSIQEKILFANEPIKKEFHLLYSLTNKLKTQNSQLEELIKVTQKRVTLDKNLSQKFKRTPKYGISRKNTSSAPARNAIHNAISISSIFSKLPANIDRPMHFNSNQRDPINVWLEHAGNGTPVAEVE